MNKIKNLSIIILTIFIPFITAGPFDPNNLNNFAISTEVAEYIFRVLPEGSTILELGSGSGTGELAKYYKIYSIEDSADWLYKYDSTYIYAPIKNYGNYKWYDADYLKDNLPTEYDMILIDGPPGPVGRFGFYHHFYLFNPNVMIIFDDTHRSEERNLFNHVAAILKRPTHEIRTSDGRRTTIIAPAPRPS